MIVTLPVIFNSLDTVDMTSGVKALLATAQKAESELVLSVEDARGIMYSRRHTLEELGRLDLSIGVSTNLLKRLIESPFAEQKTLAETASDLYEIFHNIKNETSDFVSDEEIVDAMMKLFNGACGGSSQLLAGKGSERIIQNYKEGKELSDTSIMPDQDEEYMQ